jgi:hypothetical protein
MAKKIGRPKKKFKKEYCDQLIDHMKEGLSFESFGAIVDCCKDTLYLWLREYPEFFDAKKRGTLHSQLWWEREGKRGMWGGKQFNCGSWIFNVRNRFGWHDKHEPSPEDYAQEESYPDVE